jgi:hypothetical protein
MGHFGEISFHIMREGVHTGSSSNKWRQIHGEQGIGKYYLSQQFGRD